MTTLLWSGQARLQDISFARLTQRLRKREIWHKPFCLRNKTWRWLFPSENLRTRCCGLRLTLARWSSREMWLMVSWWRRSFRTSKQLHPTARSSWKRRIWMQLWLHSTAWKLSTAMPRFRLFPRAWALACSPNRQWRRSSCFTPLPHKARQITPAEWNCTTLWGSWWTIRWFRLLRLTLRK